MMKRKILAILLSCGMLLLTGCVGVNTNIKLSSTNMSAADFLSVALNELRFISTSASNQVAGTGHENNYEALELYALSGEDVAISAIFTIDFCIEIAERENQLEINQKIYEIVDDTMQQKCIIFIGKVAGKSNVFNALQYVVDLDEDYSDIVADERQEDLRNQFTVYKDKSSGGYSFSDVSNGVVGEFIYDSYGGHMGLEMSYQIQITSVETLQAKMDFYNYTNDVIGGRIITTASIENQPQKIIFEYLAKEFEKRAKMGTVKNESLYYNMEATKESNIATSNAGDDIGFDIAYVDNSDTAVAYTTVSEYGVGA